MLPFFNRTGQHDGLSWSYLAEDIHSDTDMPLLNKSAVDGFACRVADLDHDLEVIETIPAGKLPEFRITEGKCSRIMTRCLASRRI